MDLPSMLKRNEINERVRQAANVAIKENRNVEYYEEIKAPKVKFKDIELEVSVGQWMEVLANKSRTQAGEGLAFITSISASTLLKYGVSRDELNMVDKAFGELLLQIGVPEDEICIIDDYDDKACSFNCHFQNMNEDAKMRISWGSMDDMPELVVDYKNVYRCYDFYAEREDRPRKLELASFRIQNPENNNEVYSWMSPFTVNYTITNGSRKMTIKVERPDYVEELYDYVFRINDDLSFVQYLLGVSFPVSVDQVYKELSSRLDKIEDNPIVEVKATETYDNKKDRVTDHILVKNGKLCNFVLTRNGKKVGFDCQGNTVYEEKSFAVNKNKDGGVEYRLNIEPNEDMGSVGTVSSHVGIADEGVDEIRTLAKTLTGDCLKDNKYE